MNIRTVAAAFLLAGALLQACTLTAPQGSAAPEVLLAVVSKGLPGITLYDAATDRQICQARLGVAPHEAAFSLDGRTLYVPIYSSANIGQPGPDGRSIEFIRTSDCSVEASMDMGEFKRPHFIEQGASGLLYVTAEMNQSVLLVDPKRRAIVGALPTGSGNSHFFAKTSDERLMFTSNVSDRTLSVIDIPGRKLLATVDAGASNQRMTISPDNKWFVTSLWQSKQIAFYRSVDHQLDFAVDIDGAPFVARFSTDGKFLYNMGTEPGTQPAGIRVWKIEVATRKVVATSSDALGFGSGGIQLNPANGQLYVTAYSGQVNVLDPVTLKRVRHFTAPDTPDGLFFGKLREARK